MKLRQTTSVTVIILACLLFIQACTGTQNQNTPAKLKRGYLEFELVKVGIPEENVKKAIFSFAPDPNGTLGDKTQYLSRNLDANGGQYLIQCRNNLVYEVQVYHLKKPVTKDVAMATLKNLLPQEARPDQPPAQNPDKQKPSSECLRFAGTYEGELVYANPASKGVTIINAWFVPSTTAKP